MKKIKKQRPKTSGKQRFLHGLRDAIHQIKLAKEGKVKLKNADQLLNEL